MISLSEIEHHISFFPEAVICEGASRKYVEHEGVIIYLHPVDPRFGATLEGTLYSFRRPKGPRGTEAREAGVNYRKPRVLKGHRNYRGDVMITITPYDKRRKDNLVNEIFRDRQSPRDKVGFINGDKTDFSSDNMFWSPNGKL